MVQYSPGFKRVKVVHGKACRKCLRKALKDTKQGNSVEHFL